MKHREADTLIYETGQPKRINQISMAYIIKSYSVHIVVDELLLLVLLLANLNVQKANVLYRYVSR